MAEEQTTEDTILDNIGEGTNDAQGTETQDTGTPEGAEGTTTEATTTPPDGTTAAQGDGTQSEGQQTRGPNDLIDSQGNVVAKGGPDRRHYENWQKQLNTNTALSNENTTLRAQVDAFNSSSTLGTQYTLSPEELTTGAQIMKAWKEDPAGTVKYMLTQAQALGHNVDIGGTTDTAAIKTMIDQALAPIMQEQQQKVTQANDQAAATQQYNQFIGTYPDAQTHVESLTRLLESDNNLSLEAAYFKLRNFYLERNLDWSKPLQTLQTQARTQQTVTSQGATQQQLPSGNANVTTVTDSAEVANADESFDNIIRQSMQEAGLKLN